MQEREKVGIQSVSPVQRLSRSKKCEATETVQAGTDKEELLKEGVT